MSFDELRRRGDSLLGRGLQSAGAGFARVPRQFFEVLLVVLGAFVMIYLYIDKSQFYAVGYVVVLFAVLFLIRRPVWLSYTLFAFIPIYWLNLLGRSLRVVTVLTFIGAVYYLGRLALTRTRPVLNPVYLGYLAFSFTCVYGLVNSGILIDQFWPSIKYFVFALLIVFVLVESVKTERDLRVLLWLLIGWGVIESVLGMLQTFVSDRFFFQSTHLTIVDAYSVDGVRRASGTFQVGPRYAMYLLGPLALVVTGLFTGRVLSRRTWLLLLLPFVVGVFVSLTRIAIFLSVLYLVLFNVFERRRRALMASIAGMLVIATMTGAIALVIPGRYKNALVERFTSKDEEVYMDRLYFLWNALGAFSEHPVLGVGLGTYEIRSWEFMQKYPVPWRNYRWSVAEQWSMPESVPVHNEYGRMLAEQGIFSLPAFLFLFAMAFRNLYRAYRRSGNPLVQLWATAMSMYLAALGVYFYFHEYFMEEPYISIIPFAMSIVLYNHVRRTEAEPVDAPVA